MALFETLFDVHIKHYYYESEYSSDFKAIPAKETKRFMQGAGLIFRAHNSGFKIMGEVLPAGQDKFELLSSFNKFTRFQFFLKQTKPHFLNYTDLPFHRPGKEIYYFNNQQSNVEGQVKYLHPLSNRVEASSKMKLKKGVYTYVHSGNEAKKTVHLVFPDLDIVVEQTAENNENEFTFQFDLTNYANGRAELRIDGNIEESFYAVNRRDMAGIFGVIEILNTPGTPSEYRFMEPNGVLKKQEYTLAFQNRSTHWRYLVIDRSGMNLDTPGIEDNDPQGYTFSKDATGSYPAEYEVFVSDQEIPLSETRLKTLKLSQKVNSSRKSVQESLPNPGVQLLKQDENNQNTYYSEVYLYM